MRTAAQIPATLLSNQADPDEQIARRGPAGLALARLAVQLRRGAMSGS
jgi:hypothetical protein